MAKWYYNGVLLPEIPSEILAKCPYAWIRLNSGKTYYDLIVGANPWWCNSSKMYTTNSYNERYQASVTDETWTFGSSYTDEGGWDIGAELLWSSHDIPNGSATASEIYFAGSYPIDENGNEVGKPEEPEPTYDEKYTVKSEWLVSMADEVRRLTGSTDKLTPEQMETGLKGVSVGGGLAIASRATGVLVSIPKGYALSRLMADSITFNSSATSTM